MEQANFIPEEEYKKIFARVPLPCIDFVVVCSGSFLLGKRVNAPAQGQWFLPGGRILKNETMEQAIERKFAEELGIFIPSSRATLLLVKETIFPEMDPPRHTVNAVYVVELQEQEKVSLKPDPTQTSEIEWLDSIDERWHPCVCHCLERCGFSVFSRAAY